MKILVTGADGFVGTWLVGALRARGDEVVGAVQGVDAAIDGVETFSWNLTDGASIQEVIAKGPFDAVVHLAGVASGSDASRDAIGAWEVNAVGTARVLQCLLDAPGGCGTRVLVVSTAEVYGSQDARVPIGESLEVRPCSPYAASKLGAEIAALEAFRRTKIPVIVARSFPHTGRGQDRRFVIPAFAHRLHMAKQRGAPVIEVGNLHPVRDILHVSDVVDAYLRLVDAGVPGETYNVASGRGRSLEAVLDRMCDLLEFRPITEVDASLVRSVDIPYLVGDGTKLRDLTGWEPKVSFDEILTEVLDAQAN